MRRWIIRGLLGLGVLFLMALVGLAFLPSPLPPESVELILAQARAAETRNDPAAAAKALADAVLAAPTDDNRLWLARNLLRAGRGKDAGDALDDLDDPARPEARWLRSRALLLAGDAAKAAEALAKAGDYRAAHPIDPEPSPYVGAQACAACHEDKHRVQQNSRHARTFARAADLADLELPDGPIVDAFGPLTTHTIAREDGKIVQSTKVENDLFRVVAEYAFGSGDRGLTPIGLDHNGMKREFRLSKYAQPHGWQVTSGQTMPPRNKELYSGRPLSNDDFHLCFECHTTVADAAIANAGPTAADRSIGCEQCHGPGAAHIKAVEAKLPDLMIARARPGEADGGVQDLCARCHSPKKSGTSVDPMTQVLDRLGKNDIRFQSVTLPRSRCVTESRGALDCLTCHSPHANAETDAAFYEAKCLACHAPERPTTRASCKVNPTKGCIGCHMPASETAVPHSTFTDHHIRVHRAPEGPPPLLKP